MVVGPASDTVVPLNADTAAILDRLAQFTGLPATELMRKAGTIFVVTDTRVKPGVDLLDLTHEPMEPPEADSAGIRRLILMIALWLIAVGLPVAETKLPVSQQAVITNEFATVALALAVTWRLLDNRRK